MAGETHGVAEIPSHMKAVVLTGHGGLERLELRDDAAVPEPAPGEVLIEVGACGLNNTDINTRIGWYSKSVSGGTTAEAGAEGFAETGGDSTWERAGLAFPRIQGADVIGHVVALGKGVPKKRLGQRVLVDPWIRDPDEPERRELAGYFGSERDGGYAEFTTAPAVNAVPIDSDLSDPELATFPCSYSTAEYMLTRARVSKGETLLVTGASGGVGSALLQLAGRRGARVIAVAGRAKMGALADLGTAAVLAREDPDLLYQVRELAPDGVDVAADIVGGPGFPGLLDLLARGGRYVTSGAIAGPIVELDLRTLYLKDLELVGATVMPAEIFRTLVGYIERGEVRPLLAKTFPLERLRDAQAEFLEKRHVGNLVVVPG